MNTVDQIRIAAEHLSTAMYMLEQLGADLTAAKVSSAMDSFRTELRTITWHELSEADFNQLDAMVDSIFTDDTRAHQRILP